MQAIANGTKEHTDWNSVDWRKANRCVRNLRQRIFRASQAGDLRKVASLQKLMLRSYSNALLAVRRVTQVNKGKDTPGVDKVVVKTPAARGQLVDTVRSYQPWRASPVRRIYIPKANGKRRPLGIPTVRDRALQALVLNALEPFWEARFEGCSYGFRPRRGCHDAIEKIYGLARPNKRKKWVLDADIKGAFDAIDHQALLDAIGPFPARELVKQWLKAGYVETGRLHATESGTPQGGVISPLLANIALHGLEAALGVKYRRGQIEGPRALVRYADDFVVFCETKEDALAAQAIVADWVATRGLTLSTEKTQIVHLSDGFDFLGFNIRHYPAPKTSRSGWKLLIKPSAESVQGIKAKLAAEWRSLLGSDMQTVLARLNPIIRGWATYYRTVVAKHTFADLDNWIFQRCHRHVKRTHPTKSWAWRSSRYWGNYREGSASRWVFGTGPDNYLLKFAWTPIKRHVLVKGTAAPDDPTLRAYWDQRNQRKNQNLTKKRARLAQWQRGYCSHCGMSLHNGEELHDHHLVPRNQGGSDEERNRRLVHLYCHQQIHGRRA
jgi:RNA-directed DNA polymerase